MKTKFLALNLILVCALLFTGIQPAQASLLKPSPKQAGISYLPGFYDTSVFLVGKVVVSVIFIESSGNGENWSQLRKDEVSAKITNGLTLLGGAGGMDASLNFLPDLRTITVSQEPITLASSDTSWMFSALGTIPGVSGADARERAFSFNNQQRTLYDSDWAFTLFVVDSLNDANGAFSDGVFAFSEIYGPYAVITYDNGSHGTATLDIATARETAHVFGAGYQDDGSCTSTTQLFGYLGVANSNCVIGGVDPLNNGIPRLMKDLDVWGDPDQTTREQLGWRDSGGTQFVLDPLDTTIAITTHLYDPHFTAASDLRYVGSAQEEPFPHATCSPSDFCYGKDVDINHISDMHYRADTGVWANIAAADGAFDSQYEEFSFTASISGDGSHSLDIRALHTTHNGPPLDDLNNPPVYESIFSDSIEKAEQYRGDDAAGPIIVSSVPTNDVRNTLTDTLSWDDPAPTGCDGGNDLRPGQATVWYQLTSPQDRAISISADGSSYDTFMVIYTGTRGNLTQMICLDDVTPSGQPSYILNAVAGTTYLIEFAAYDGFIQTSPQKRVKKISPAAAGGTLVVSFRTSYATYLPYISR
ncbi:MAG: hypothetical protein Fur0035_01220 [Anaerolineales bacterium]